MIYTHEHDWSVVRAFTEITTLQYIQYLSNCVYMYNSLPHSKLGFGPELGTSGKKGQNILTAFIKKINCFKTCIATIEKKNWYLLRGSKFRHNAYAHCARSHMQCYRAGASEAEPFWLWPEPNLMVCSGSDLRLLLSS